MAHIIKCHANDSICFSECTIIYKKACHYWVYATLFTQVCPFTADPVKTSGVRQYSSNMDDGGFLEVILLLT